MQGLTLAPSCNLNAHLRGSIRRASIRPSHGAHVTEPRGCCAGSDAHRADRGTSGACRPRCASGIRGSLHGFWLGAELRTPADNHGGQRAPGPERWRPRRWRHRRQTPGDGSTHSWAAAARLRRRRPRSEARTPAGAQCSQPHRPFLWSSSPSCGLQGAGAEPFGPQGPGTGVAYLDLDAEDVLTQEGWCAPGRSGSLACHCQTFR